MASRGWRLLLREGRTARALLQEAQGIRTALDRIATALEHATGRGTTFRGSLQRPGEVEDKSALVGRNPDLLIQLDSVEKDLARVLGRAPSLEELEAEASRRELI